VIDFPARAWRLIALDSDGDVNLLIQPWIDAGIDLLYPREVRPEWTRRGSKRNWAAIFASPAMSIKGR
jgi:hypothetical protein